MVKTLSLAKLNNKQIGPDKHLKYNSGTIVINNLPGILARHDTVSI